MNGFNGLSFLEIKNIKIITGALKKVPCFTEIVKMLNTV